MKLTPLPIADIVMMEFRDKNVIFEHDDIFEMSGAKYRISEVNCESDISRSSQRNCLIQKVTFERFKDV